MEQRLSGQLDPLISVVIVDQDLEYQTALDGPDFSSFGPMA